MRPVTATKPLILENEALERIAGEPARWVGIRYVARQQVRKYRSWAGHGL